MESLRIDCPGVQEVANGKENDGEKLFNETQHAWIFVCGIVECNEKGHGKCKHNIRVGGGNRYPRRISKVNQKDVKHGIDDLMQLSASGAF